MDRRSKLKSAAAALADRAPWLIDLYRFALHPHWEADIWRDYRSTHRKLDWLRRLPPSPGDAPRVLLVMRREDLFDVKHKLMLGTALELEGAAPVVLANYRRVPRIRRYAGAFGVDALRFRDEFPLGAGDWKEVGALTAELMRREHDFAAVREWTYRGQPLGDRVLSTLIRETLAGEPDLDDPDVRFRMRRILVLALANYRQAEAVLDAVRPRWVLADETGYVTNGPLVDVALSRGLDVFETTPFLRDGTLVFKRMNTELGRDTAASVSRATLEAVAQRPWTASEDAAVMAEIERRYTGGSSLQRMYQWNTETADRGEICREFGLDPARPIAVVFTHVLWDASFFYGRDLFRNYHQWLEQTLHVAVSNPRVSWLIKTHPANVFRLRHGDVRGPVAEVEVVRRTVEALPGHVRLVLPDTSVSSLSLYRYADVGITVRGTAGLEMACFGKPVLTAGSGHYSGLGFTVDSASREQYLERLQRITDHLAPLGQEQTIGARRYAHALFELRPWAARSFAIRHDFPQQGRHPLDRNLVPVATSLDEAQAHGDLHRWAAWAVRSRAADYLEPSSRG